MSNASYVKLKKRIEKLEKDISTLVNHPDSFDAKLIIARWQFKKEIADSALLGKRHQFSPAANSVTMMDFNMPPTLLGAGILSYLTEGDNVVNILKHREDYNKENMFQLIQELKHDLQQKTQHYPSEIKTGKKFIDLIKGESKKYLTNKTPEENSEIIEVSGVKIKLEKHYPDNVFTFPGSICFIDGDVIKIYRTQGLLDDVKLIDDSISGNIKSAMDLHVRVTSEIENLSGITKMS